MPLKFQIAISIAVFVVILLASVLYFLTTPPKMQSGGVTFEVSKGMSTQSIAREARKDDLVRSSTLLAFVLKHYYNPNNIYAGIYRFDRPLSLFAVAQKLANNDIDRSLLSVTIPEGTARKEIAQLITQKIPNFDTATFLTLTKDKEGYLFPDTYLVRKDFTAQEFADLLVNTFEKKIMPYKTQIASSSLSEYEIVTLASIIEREGKDETSMRTIAGILENRLSLHMALQTDATIEYDLNKSLAQLTADDLKSDTPYNTYVHAGLPPTPIGNPGLRSINAVLDPIKTKYLYYITDSDGNFHYATTFEEHKRNVAKYLKNT